MMVRRGVLQRGHGLGASISSSTVVLPGEDMMARAAPAGPSVNATRDGRRLP
jgi:hypothetical protein